MSRLLVCNLCKRDDLPPEEWFSVPAGDFIGPALMQQHLTEHKPAAKDADRAAEPS